MNGLWVIAGGSGLQDGLNPCIFMACTVFIAQGLGLRKSPLSITWFRILFVLAYAAGFLMFNFGPAQVLVFQKSFILSARIFYFVLGVWAFVSGILFFKDWVLLKRGLPAKALTEEKIKAFQGGSLTAALVTIVLAVMLSALSILWPVNNFIMLLGNESFLKGQWQAVMPVLSVYIFSSMWPLWFVWAFTSIKNLAPSLLKIFYAAIFFTASSCMIFIFK